MQAYIQYKGNKIPYTILRRKRKTVGISVRLDRGVQVAAPLHITQVQIQEIVASRANWIGEKLALLQQEKQKIPQYHYADGDTLPYMGQSCTLKLQRRSGTGKPQIAFDGSCITIELPEDLPMGEQSEWIRSVLIRWYKMQAQAFVESRAGFYSAKMGVVPVKVAVKEQKTLWGSCSGKNSIHINWKLIMAPLAVLDYVVVHELAHIKQKNHSKAFWAVVESILPGYREQVGWLKKNGMKLVI